MTENQEVFARPRSVEDISQCYFYQTTELPGQGVVAGEWDLRDGLDDYLGRVDFRGKRVLDVGAASGFLTFAIEKAGAEVIAYDLSENHPWDIVPHRGRADAAIDSARREHMRRINSSFWYCHRVFGSRAQLAHGTVYDIPEAIGPVDIAVFGSILLHLRDPFQALAAGARLCREAVIVTDKGPFGPLGHLLIAPRFVPRPDRPSTWDTWWRLPPRLVARYLAILGFPNSTVTWHRQRFLAGHIWLYTVVARR